MKNTVFTGAATAIVTPMTNTGIDYKNYEKLIEWQIENGIVQKFLGDLDDGTDLVGANGLLTKSITDIWHETRQCH